MYIDCLALQVCMFIGAVSFFFSRYPDNSSEELAGLLFTDGNNWCDETKGFCLWWNYCQTFPFSVGDWGLEWLLHTKRNKNITHFNVEAAGVPASRPNIDHWFKLSRLNVPQSHSCRPFRLLEHAHQTDSGDVLAVTCFPYSLLIHFGIVIAW